MSKHKSDGKKKKKGSQLVIRLDKDERDAFVALCDKLDTSAAREIRSFMCDWVGANATKAEVEPVTEQLATETFEAPPVTEAAPAETASSGTIADQSEAAIETEAKPKAKRKAAAK